MPSTLSAFDVLGALVHAEEDDPVLGRLLDGQAVGAVDALKVLHRHVLKEVDLTREKRGDAGRGVLDRGIDDLAHFHGELVTAPVVLVAGHDGFHVRLAAGQHVGAGAVRVGGGVGDLTALEVLHVDGVARLGPALVHDEEVGEVGGQDRVRPVCHHLDGVVIDGAHLGDGADQLLHVGVFLLGPLEGEDHVFRGEVLTAVELDPFAQLEGPDIGVRFGGAPLRRQGRLEGAGHVADDQGFVHLVTNGVGRPLVLGVGVEREGIAGAGPIQGLRGGQRGAGQQHGRGQQGSCPFHEGLSLCSIGGRSLG